MSNIERFNYLLRGYVSGTISIEEHEELFGLLSTHEYDHLLDQAVQNDLKNGITSQNADLPPHIAQEIIRNIISAEKNTAEMLPAKKELFSIWQWMAAASIILIVVTAYIFSPWNNTASKHAFASIIPANIITYKNNSDSEQMVALSDSSQIFLKPKSAIHYPAKFITKNREVYLEGEAFFKVAKNPQKPFLVFYNKIVTKVLGTSFTINTNAQTGNVEVSVKTGRVQVYENDKIIQFASSDKGVILAPNQKAIYKEEQRLFQTTLVEIPQLIGDRRHPHEDSLNVPVQNFNYEQEKLGNVLHELEEAYGIEIVVESTDLYNSVFSGDVSDPDLFTKLKIICLATNSSFEINGTKILIRGKEHN